jgi:hypothetical protein
MAMTGKLVRIIRLQAKIKSDCVPVVIADQEGPVAAGVQHLFEGLVHAGKQILNYIRSKLENSLEIRRDVLGRHALQQVNRATELICGVHQ